MFHGGLDIKEFVNFIWKMLLGLVIFQMMILTNTLNQHFKHVHRPIAGQSLALGYLRSLGLRVQQERVAKVLLRVDATNSGLRWAALINRRKYNVPGPNSLWHIDGHHSLVSSEFAIHGGMDGFSRSIVYLKCTTNNRKETVCELFEGAISIFGVPR